VVSGERSHNPKPAGGALTCSERSESEKEKKMPTKVYALVTLKDGKAQIRECKLRDSMPFGKEEMRKWLMEKDKSIKEIKFLNAKEFELYKLVVKGLKESHAQKCSKK